jgi:glycosyltransferase involved in cell wall biosynthesis
MYQENFDIAYKTKINSDLLIINQCDREDYQEMKVNGYLWRMISTKDRGSSQSRNLALNNARGVICQLCDDDEILVSGYRQIILQAFDELPKASIIGFNVHRINVTMKKKYYSITKAKETDAYRSFASPMVAFRLKDIKEKNILFNENFGSGTPWGPGEDSLFQRDARKAGLKLYEYPVCIATQDYSNESKWFCGYDEKYFYNQGAFAEYCGINRVYREVYNLYSFFYKYRRELTLSPFDKWKWKHRGEKGWRNQVTYAQYIENNNSYSAKQEEK